MTWTVKACCNDSNCDCTFFNPDRASLGIISNWYPANVEEEYGYVVEFKGTGSPADLELTAYEMGPDGQPEKTELELRKYENHNGPEVRFTAYTATVFLNFRKRWRVECNGTTAKLIPMSLTTWHLTAVDNNNNTACSIFNWPLYDSAIGIVSNRTPNDEEDVYNFVITFSKMDDIPMRRFGLSVHEVSVYGRSKSRSIATLFIGHSKTISFTASTAIVCLRFNGSFEILVNEGGKSVKITQTDEM